MDGRPRILQTRDLPEPGPALLAGAGEVVRPAPGDLAGAARGCAAIVCLTQDRIDERVLATPGLRVVSNVAVGYDNIDVAAANRHRVMVTNTPGVLDETTADLAFALILAAARRTGEAERYLRSGRFTGWSMDLLVGRDVHGATLGIVGAGRIGQAVARRARGFGMSLLYAAEHPIPAAREVELGLRPRPLDALLAEADFVSLHVPLRAETRHLIDERRLRLMKSTAVLVNTARGPVVDERALARALAEGWIMAAGLDVFENEPAVEPALLGLENVVLLPHIGSSSVLTRSRMAERAALNCAAALAGRRPPDLLNPVVLE